MSFPDTIVLFVLALLLFGPKKLPQIARQIGKALGEFRRASNEFKAQIEAEISQLEFEEKRKEREQKEQESKSLPTPEPVSESVQSSRYALPAEASEPAAPSADVSSPAHTSHA
jgi:sec-independent protein translocase protein TatB